MFAIHRLFSAKQFVRPTERKVNIDKKEENERYSEGADAVKRIRDGLSEFLNFNSIVIHHHSDRQYPHVMFGSMENVILRYVIFVVNVSRKIACLDCNLFIIGNESYRD